MKNDGNSPPVRKIDFFLKSLGSLLKVEIETLINKLPTREQYLVRARYMEKKTWEQIAVEMCYSWPQVHRIHSNALRILEIKS